MPPYQSKPNFKLHEVQLPACALCRDGEGLDWLRCRCGVRFHQECATEFGRHGCPTIGCRSKPSPEPRDARQTGCPYCTSALSGENLERLERYYAQVIGLGDERCTTCERRLPAKPRGQSKLAVAAWGLVVVIFLWNAALVVRAIIDAL